MKKTYVTGNEKNLLLSVEKIETTVEMKQINI